MAFNSIENVAYANIRRKFHKTGIVLHHYESSALRSCFNLYFFSDNDITAAFALTSNLPVSNLHPHTALLSEKKYAKSENPMLFK